MLTGRWSLLSRSSIFAAIAISLAQSGCDKSHERVPRMEPNLLYAHAIEMREELDLSMAVNDAQVVLTDWFGTLNDPKIPPSLESEFGDLLSLENLNIAAGPPPESAEPGERGLYRQLCASCHGETGQGRGPVAASQNPYPREFRLGLYKFKSTTRNGKPLKSDLRRILVEGLADSQMPKFNHLSDKQLDALVDYVIFLSIRGEFERKMYQNSMDSDAEPPRVYDVSLRDSANDESKEAFQEQLELAEEALYDASSAWAEAEDDLAEIEEPDFPLWGRATEDDQSELEESIAKGKALFGGEIAACAKCHGNEGRGDGPQAPDYDDWTRDWTSKMGFDPTDLDEILPLMARGGLKPQPIKPRDLVAGHFRGGRLPADIYHRIRYGISGSTMPAAAFAHNASASGLTEIDIWHLVNFVLSIAQEPAPATDAITDTQESAPAAEVPAAEAN